MEWYTESMIDLFILGVEAVLAERHPADDIRPRVMGPQFLKTGMYGSVESRRKGDGKQSIKDTWDEKVITRWARQPDESKHSWPFKAPYHPCPIAL